MTQPCPKIAAMVKLENTEILNIQEDPGGSKYASKRTFIHFLKIVLGSAAQL